MTFSVQEQEFFDREVHKRFGDLANQGFVVGHVFRQVGITGEQLAVTVSYAAVGSELEIKLLRTPDGAREALAAFVQKGGANGTGGFAFDNYLKRIGASAAERDALALSKQRGAFSERVVSVLEAIRRVLDQHLLAALMGGKWPEVPTDWGDYK